MRHSWDDVGQPERRRSPLRARLVAGATLLSGALVVGALTAMLTGLSAANAPAGPPEAVAEVAALRDELADVRGKLALAEVRIERMSAISKYSALYKVPADLAGAIHDVAVAEGIHPSLGFQLVKVESGFKASARSHKGAIGYTQVRIKTARAYEPNITEAALHDRDTNLRIGFRFLKDMLAQFDQDLHMALLAYNRGPGRVVELMTKGEDPANGYSQAVLDGVKKGS